MNAPLPHRGVPCPRASDGFRDPEHSTPSGPANANVCWVVQPLRRPRSELAWLVDLHDLGPWRFLPASASTKSSYFEGHAAAISPDFSRDRGKTAAKSWPGRG